MVGDSPETSNQGTRERLRSHLTETSQEASFTATMVAPRSSRSKTSEAVSAIGRSPDPDTGHHCILGRLARPKPQHATRFRLLGRLDFSILKPRQPILGTELAGVVEAVGKDVKQFQPGDEVIAFTGGRFGSHAEYRTMPEDGLIIGKPANLTFEEAASLLLGGVHALTFLRDKAAIIRGDRVLVVGASGAIGAGAVQVAKLFGAEVTASPAPRTRYSLPRSSRQGD